MKLMMRKGGIQMRVTKKSTLPTMFSLRNSTVCYVHERGEEKTHHNMLALFSYMYIQSRLRLSQQFVNVWSFNYTSGWLGISFNYHTVWLLGS